MAVINQSIGGGGAKINGVIEQYRVAAGENISAGDFVQFVHEVGSELNLGTQSSWAGLHTTKAVQLDQNRVLVISENNILLVVTIDGTQISKGTAVQSLTFDSPYDAVLVGTDKVLFAYTSSSKCYCSILTINDTEVSVSSTEYIYQGENARSMCLLDTNRVFIAHGIYTNSYLYGVVVSISGTTIIPGTDTRLSSEMYSNNVNDICLIDEDKVLIVCENNYGYFIIATANGTNISVITETDITGNTYNSYKLRAIDTNKIVVVRSYNGTSTRELESAIGIINGNNITFYDWTEIAIPGNDYNGNEINITLISQNKMHVSFFSGTATNYMYPCGIVVYIDGTTCTQGVAVQLGNYSNSAGISSALAGPGVMLVSYAYYTNSNGPTYFTGIVDSISPAIADPSNVKGIAKSPGAQGEVIDVYVPE